MNRVVLIGRLASDPHTSYTTTGKAKCQFTLAVNRPKNKDGETNADFIRITVWGAQGENCDRYLSKGRQVAVEARIETGSYPKDGKTIYTTDIVANNVEFLGSKTSRSTEDILEEASDLLDFHPKDDGMPW